MPEGADARRRAADELLPLPGLDLDPAIPRLDAVVSHGFGRDVSSSAEVHAYLRALASAAPFRSRLIEYGRSVEGRPLAHLVITSAANLERLDEIRSANLRLADPRGLDESAAEELCRTQPAIVWLAYTVHGNESSGSDAALLTAYHLLADRRADTRAVLERVVIVIDPLQNPDGRARFVSAHRESRGAFPDADPLAVEHGSRWASGRYNHYLFDLNRDWFLQSQVETRARVAAYLEWRPQVTVDAHEMGRNSSYYFPPPAEPVHALVLDTQRAWFRSIGEHHARRFDEYGFSYTTRELYDSFYPGYGESWPTLQGAIGLLWEQASVRGLIVRREDEQVSSYADAVLHHYVSGLATLETVARFRKRLLEDFVRIGRDTLALAGSGDIADFFLLEGDRPRRAWALAQLLLRNGIEVARLRREVRALGRSVQDGTTAERTLPAGSYRVSLRQPAGRLARTLLERHSDMGEAFVERQLERRSRRVSDEIYDVTAWSLPLAQGVECVSTVGAIDVDAEPLVLDVETRKSPALGRAAGVVIGGRASVAYVVPSSSHELPRALAEWLRAGYRAAVLSEPTTLGGIALDRGAIVLRVSENPASLHDAVVTAAERFGLRIVATNTGFVDDGAHLGGPHARWIRPPRVAQLIGPPASTRSGHAWFLFDQRYRWPLTRIEARYAGRIDWDRLDVLVLPDGSWTSSWEISSRTTERLRTWVRDGGTLILIGGACEWASSKRVDLLEASPERAAVEPVGGAPDEEKSDSEPAEKREEKPARERPPSVPGAFLRARVYPQHWISYGVPSEIDVLMRGSLVFSSMSPLAARPIVSFVPERDRLLTSGFCWPQTLDLLPNRSFAIHQSLGKGHVVAFAADPNHRAMLPDLARLFFNAVFFGPSY